MKRNILVSLLAVAISAAFFLFPTGNAVPGSGVEAAMFATTLTVDRVDDAAAAMACTAAANDCSLRGAIRASNSNLGGTEVIIVLAVGATYNLTLPNTAQENSGATGDLDINAANHDVTVRGGGSAGVNATTISAAGLNAGASRDRVLHIVGGGKTVSLDKVIIADGRAFDDGTNGASALAASQTTVGTGGGILSQGGGLSLTDVAVLNCRAQGKGDTLVNEHTTLDARGGGLASLSVNASVKIDNARFSGNTAAGGNGGIFNNGAGSNALGGSIYFAGGTLNVTRSRLDKSNATGGNGGNQDQNGQTNGGFGGFAQGGGIWAGGGTIAITDTSFTTTVATGGNSGTGGNASNPGGDASGGGLYSLSNATVNSSTFELAAANGGHGGNTFGSTCLGGHEGGNGGAARGGAILADGGTMTIDSSTFGGNTATGGNGASGGQTNGGLNCGNHGAGGLAYGGAITNNTAVLTISHSTISQNKARAGNTGINQGGANKPPQPVAEGAGGGIRVGPVSVSIATTIISGNTASNGLGNATGAPVPGPNVDGGVTSGGHNLLGVSTDATGFTGTGDKIGANPMLGPLADNGGPTRTMSLMTGSGAIDAGVAGGAVSDQRGQPRTTDDASVPNAATSDGTDIGSVEVGRQCDLCCPNNIVVTAAPGQRGAVVTYKPDVGKGCGRSGCDHPSGTFFPIGETIVTCKTAAGPSCSFKVTVIRPGMITPL